MDKENEKGPAYKGKAAVDVAASRMKDDKKLPADSEMQKTVEQAKAADGKSPAERHLDLSRPRGK